MLNRVEALIRTYDPCLSCSTHAFGEMPLVAQLFNSVWGVVARGAQGLLSGREVFHGACSSSGIRQSTALR